MTDVYRIELRCRNCRIYKKHAIPKGTTVENYKEGIECSECGCKI